MGAKSGGGYGIFKLNASNTGAHRASYEHYIGRIPEKMVVCHTCDNVSCVNPKHLWVGTQKDNLEDMYQKGRGRKLDTYKNGEQHCNSKLTNQQVVELRSLYQGGGYSWTSIGKKFGISKRAAGHIVRFETYKYAS